MTVKIEIDVDHPDLILGIVLAEGVAVRESDDELRNLAEDLVRRRAEEEFPPEPRRTAVRKLLRAGGFKPAGRSKPASEYLAGRARSGEYPFHSNLVDICNHVSLLSGLPISILDLDLALGGGDALAIRLGEPGEKYVFNPSGQEIDVAGLLLVARPDGDPLGNPVKDSMRSKVRDGTTRTIAVIYGSKQTVDETEMSEHVALFADLLRRHAGAANVETRVMP